MFAGFSCWNYAFSEKPSQHGNTRSAHAPVHPVYRPQFFAPDKYHTVELLADLILPPTHTSGSKKQPGAKEAGVAEFIDFMVFSDVSLQAPFRDGLVWLDKASTPAASFLQLGPAEQTATLTRLAYKAKYRDDEKAGQQFFRLVRKYTVTGFYTTRIGLEALDFPGLTFYGTSPGCTHEGNPEHTGL
jgi:hypothetical protein